MESVSGPLSCRQWQNIPAAPGLAALPALAQPVSIAPSGRIDPTVLVQDSPSATGNNGPHSSALDVSIRKRDIPVLIRSDPASGAGVGGGGHRLLDFCVPLCSASPRQPKKSIRRTINPAYNSHSR